MIDLMKPKKEYEPEIEKLAKGLEERGIKFVSHPLYDGFQIVVKHGKTGWDAVCHSGSYGHEQGLLEIMGNIVRGDNAVEGYLTAEDILERIGEKK